MLTSLKPFVARHATLIVLALLCAGVKLFSVQAALVEEWYTYGLYPILAKALRLLFGSVSLSIGDVGYLFIAIYLIYVVVKLFKLIKHQTFNRNLFYYTFKKAVTVLLAVYLVFNVCWGLNYNRLGIAHQLGLGVTPYTVQELYTLSAVLKQRVNACATLTDTTKRKSLHINALLFAKGIAAYKQAAVQFPFLAYDFPSVKPSLYTSVGQFMGFTGYYNPFSGEAQLKTNVPVFLKPFIVNHEIAHQLGYAKENEANFISYLSCRSAADVNMRYSIYFELLLYANRELMNNGMAESLFLQKGLHPLVIKDYKELLLYLEQSENLFEPIVSAFYDQYLKLNSQPKGTRTYNDVIAWLIAYQKKYGLASI